MAFALAGFYPDQRGAGFRVHTYSSTDLQAVVEASGYFDSLASVLQVGDMITCLDSTTNITYSLEVTAISAADVVTTNRPTVTAPAVISGTGATATLTSAQSGSTVFFDRAAGIVFTLPVPVVGLKYRFVVTVSVTSNAMSVVTDAATTFMVGGLQGYIDTTAVTEGHFANGSTHIGISSNGTTTGGLIGTVFEVECVSATVWLVTGLLGSSGTLATPFTT